MRGDRRDTRERILRAATQLFDANGVRLVSIDVITAHANLSKRTFYCHFRSKDDLIAACLRNQDNAISETFDLLVSATDISLEQGLWEMFGRLARLASHKYWKGCGFARAAFELAGLPGHPAVVMARNHRNQLETWLGRELLRANVVPADICARRLMILIDGAITLGVIHHDPDYVTEAGRMAVELIGRYRAAAPCDGTVQSRSPAQREGGCATPSEVCSLVAEAQG